MPFLRHLLYLLFVFVVSAHPLDYAKSNLSDYGFFKEPLSQQIPSDYIFPYKLTTPLFTDYALKSRFIVLQDGQKMEYINPEKFSFPIGTSIIKTFFYPEDFRSPEDNLQIIETRLLVNTPEGWTGFPYIWNEEQTDAELEVAGGRKQINWVDEDGKNQSVNYLIPNFNMCKGCHVIDNVFQPIGPKPRLMNCDNYYNPKPMNQLQKMLDMEMVEGMPDISSMPVTPDWENPQYNLEERARAYLDVNCAHCHNSKGPANTSGLFLDFGETDMKKLGIFKPPVAAGRGSGNLKFNIVPGQPDESILVYRMESTDPGILMPESGRKLVHKEGVNLIREWIKSMEKF